MSTGDDGPANAGGGNQEELERRATAALVHALGPALEALEAADLGAVAPEVVLDPSRPPVAR